MTRLWPDDLVFRHPAEADHATVMARAEGWWPGRRGRSLIVRTWFRHAAGTSWIAAAPDGRLAGFALGFASPDDATIGILHAVATSPNLRRAGVGRALLGRLVDSLAERGARRIEAVTWPDDPGAVAFLRAMGFRAEDGSGTMRLYGTPAYPDYEGEGEDRARFIRDL